MNDLAKPDLKQGVPLSCIPEVGHRRRMQRRLKLQSAAICAVVIMMATCRGLTLDPPEPASGYVIKNFTVEDGLLSNEVNVILQTRDGFLWIGTAEVECPARFVPVEMRQTGTRGVEYGTRQEAYGGADRESAATG
jgi:hypothetical protein